MSIFKSIFRAITSPVEIVARTASGVFEKDFNFDDPMSGVDVATLGVGRVIRKGVSAIKKTSDGIVSEFES